MHTASLEYDFQSRHTRLELNRDQPQMKILTITSTGHRILHSPDTSTTPPSKPAAQLPNIPPKPAHSYSVDATTPAHDTARAQLVGKHERASLKGGGNGRKPTREQNLLRELIRMTLSKPPERTSQSKVIRFNSLY